MPPEAKLGSTLIWYKASSPENMEYWFKSVDTFLEGEFHFILNYVFLVLNVWRTFVDYKKTINPETQIHCDQDSKRQEGKACKFSADSLGNCSPEKTKGKYGYPERRPCVFLKLNKVNFYKDNCNIPIEYSASHRFLPLRPTMNIQFFNPIDLQLETGRIQ